MFIPPPILLLLAIGLSYLVSFIPGLQLIASPFNLLGLGLIVIGIGLFIWSVATLQRHKTTLDPRGKPLALVTIGPYRFSRNPIYLGFFLISLGTAVLFANILAFVGPLVFFFFINTFVIPFEEETLTALFGDSYQLYRKRTRRWV